MITVLVQKEKVITCRKCSQHITQRVTKKKNKVMVDVFFTEKGYILIQKNGSVVEHRC